MISLHSSRVLVLSACLGFAACGSSSNGPSVSGSAPTISNFTATFQTSSCTREFPGNRGVMGTTLSFAFNYSAPDGNLQGGHVQLSRVYNTGDTEPHTFPIPDEATVTGTTSGQVRAGGCPRYNDSTSSTETITLVDAANRVSNSLTVTVVKPAGAP